MKTHPNRQQRRKRKPAFESLESRRLLAADPFGTSPLQPLDVNRDGRVSALDALRVINLLGTGDVPGAIDPSKHPGVFVDVSADGRGSALDALQVINALARQTPLIAVTLPNDTAPAWNNDLFFDLRTSDYALDLNVSVGELDGTPVMFRIGTSPAVDVTNQFVDGKASLSAAEIDAVFGRPLADGDHRIEVNYDSRTIAFELTVDRAAPRPVDSSDRTIRQSTDFLEVRFNEAITVESLGPDKLSFDVQGSNPSPSISIESVQIVGSHRLAVQLREQLPDHSFELNTSVPISDLAGNQSAAGLIQAFDVVDPTGIVRLEPHDGEVDVRLSRHIRVDFDSPVDSSSIGRDTLEVRTGGRVVDTSIRVGGDAMSAIVFIDDALPPASRVRLTIDGDRIMGADGLRIDADGDGLPGGTKVVQFDTVQSSQVPGTSVSGSVFESGRLNPDGSPIPIIGATLSVEGMPQLTVVTDQEGRFTLVDVPSPEFFVLIDGSTATNAPTGKFYVGTTKPFHSVRGQATELNMNGVPFDIFLPLASQDEMTPIVRGSSTTVGFGEQALSQLEEITPDVPRSDWEKLQIEIPADSVFDDRGRRATEARIFPLHRDRIPVPLPPGVDPKIVFSVEAGGAENFDVPATMVYPNVDGLAAGEQRFLYSFDHGAGHWVVTGVMTVSDDESVLVSEEGIQTVGWRFLAPNPGINVGIDVSDDGDGSGFLSGLGDLFDSTNELLGTLYDDVVGAFADEFNESLEQLVGLQDEFEMFLDDVSDAVVEEFNETIGQLDQASTEIVGLVEEFADALVDQIPITIDQLQDIATQEALNLAEDLGPLLESLVELQGDVEQLGVDFAVAAADEWIETLEQLLDVQDIIQENAELFGDALIQEFNETITQLDESSTAIEQFAVDFADALVDQLPTTFEQLVEIGTNEAVNLAEDLGPILETMVGIQDAFDEAVDNSRDHLEEMNMAVDKMMGGAFGLFFGLSGLAFAPDVSQGLNVLGAVKELKVGDSEDEIVAVGSLIAGLAGTLDGIKMQAGIAGAAFAADRFVEGLLELDHHFNGFMVEFGNALDSRDLLPDSFLGVPIPEDRFQSEVSQEQERLEQFTDAISDTIDALNELASELETGAITAIDGMIEDAQSALEQLIDSQTSPRDSLQPLFDFVQDLGESPAKATVPDNNDLVFAFENQFGDIGIRDSFSTDVHQVVVPGGGKAWIADPLENLVANITIPDLPNGTKFDIPAIIFVESDSPDSDGDGLTDEVEGIIGTDPTDADTDADGVLDGAEINQGLDPLEGVPLPTSIVASVQLRGEATEIVLATDREDRQSAFVATGDHGFAIVDISNPQTPLLLSETGLTGVTSDIDVSADGIAAVAAGLRGVYLLDVSDPLNPSLSDTIDEYGRIDRVAFGSHHLFASGETLSVIDLATSELVQQIDLGSDVVDVAFELGLVVAVTEDDQIHTLSAIDGVFAVKASLQLDDRARRLFLGEGVVYVSNFSATDLRDAPRGAALNRGGYARVDITDPEVPALIDGVATPDVASGNFKTVDNGSGLSLVAAGFRGLEVHDNANSTYDLIQQYPTPGNAHSVAVVGGIAIVADGEAGLQIINYLPTDTSGTVPTVVVQTTAVDLETRPGLQLREGTVIQVQASITNRAQVRTTRLMSNGQIIASDNSFPFTFTFDVPYLRGLQPADLTLVVEAETTQGTLGTSPAIDIEILADTSAPSLDAAEPAANSQLRAGVNRAVSLILSEPLDSQRFRPDKVNLIAAGPDGIFETADDLRVEQRTRLSGRDVIVTTQAISEGLLRVSIPAEFVVDRAGNPATGDITVDYEVVNGTLLGHGFDANRGAVFTIDAENGFFVDTLPQTDPNLFDIAYHETHGTWAVDEQSRIYRYDPATGITELVGVAGVSVNGLAFSPNGTLYASGSEIFRISMTTGRAHPVFDTGFVSAGDLAFSSEGVAYMSANEGDSTRLIRIDLVAGRETLVGSIGQFGRVLGLAFDETGRLLGLSQTGNLLTIDQGTAAGTLLADLEDPITDNAGGATFYLP